MGVNVGLKSLRLPTFGVRKLTKDPVPAQNPTTALFLKHVYESVLICNCDSSVSTMCKKQKKDLPFVLCDI